MKSRFRKQYSKIKFDTVSLCDIVKMAKVKDEEAVAGRTAAAFSMGRKVDRCRENRRSRVLNPGCPNLTDGRYCQEHQSKVNSEYEKYGRDPHTKRRYGRAWKRIRDKYAAEHPFCELCFERGVIGPYGRDSS